MENKTIPNYTIQDVRVTPEEIDAVVTNITQKTAGEVYGDKARDRNSFVYVLSIEADQYGIQTDKALPVHPQGQVPDNSKLGKILKKYGEFRVGMQIRLEKDEKGFWTIRT